jgi:hypothetical protein
MIFTLFVSAQVSQVCRPKTKAGMPPTAVRKGFIVSSPAWPNRRCHNVYTSSSVSMNPQRFTLPNHFNLKAAQRAEAHELECIPKIPKD